MTLRIEDLPDIVPAKLLAKYFNCDRTTIWRWRKEKPNFPKAKHLSTRKIVYLRCEIVAYVNSLIDSQA